MTQTIEAHRVEWRGIVFDSRLESNWAASLSHWGIEWLYHPGPIRLPNGDVYEPDFLLPEPPCSEGSLRSLMLEVKGEHGERLWKVDAARQLNPAIIVGHAIQPGWPYLTWDLDEVVGAMCNACRDLHLGYFDDFAKESEALWMPVYVGNSVANAWRRGELLGAVKSGGRRVDA